MKNKRFYPTSVVQILCLCFISLCAQAQTVNYTYDVLGRVTYVEDPVNGNRDYDYDKAGNRLLVATATFTDEDAVPGAPAKPTGLYYGLGYDCYYNVSWNASAGASYYNFRTTTEQLIKTGTSTTVNCSPGNPQSNKPVWIQACSPNNVCSSKAYF